MLDVGEIEVTAEFSEAGRVEKVVYPPTVTEDSCRFETAIFALASGWLSSIQYRASCRIPFRLSAERQIMTLWSWKASGKIDPGVNGSATLYARLKVLNPDGTLVTGDNEKWLPLPREVDKSPFWDLPKGDYEMSVELELGAVVQPSSPEGRVMASLDANFRVLDVT